MDTVKIKKINEVFFKVYAPVSVLYEISDAFEFEVPDAKFHPKFKIGMWDGKITMLNSKTNTMYIGLYSMLKKFCDDNGYELIDEPNDNGETVNCTNGVKPNEIIEFVEALNIHSDGDKLESRDYQLGAIFAACNRGRATMLSATSSGKSYMIYCIARWILEQTPEAKILIMVPTMALASQIYGDFVDYSSHNGFDVENSTQIIMDGATKIVSKNIVISTWQSIYSLSENYFNQFSAIFCDEVHTAQAKSIKGIMEKATDVPFKIGLTGSLKKSKTHEYVVQGLFGHIYIVAKTKDLIKAKHVSDINIQCIKLVYTDKEEIKILRKNKDYDTEMKYLEIHPKRNKVIRNIALNLTGSTLVLFAKQEHGDELYRLIKNGAEDDRKVFLVHGNAKDEHGNKIDVDYINMVKKTIEQEDDVIVIASYKMFSTGINIKRIFNVIAASPTKSIITILQSIGRGLRKAKGKDVFNWIDVSDFIWKSGDKTNTTYQHFIERLQIYIDEEFNYTIREMPIH